MSKLCCSVKNGCIYLSIYQVWSFEVLETAFIPPTCEDFPVFQSRCLLRNQSGILNCRGVWIMATSFSISSGVNSPALMYRKKMLTKTKQSGQHPCTPSYAPPIQQLFHKQQICTSPLVVINLSLFADEICKTAPYTRYLSQCIHNLQCKKKREMQKRRVFFIVWTS